MLSFTRAGPHAKSMELNEIGKETTFSLTLMHIQTFQPGQGRFIFIIIKFRRVFVCVHTHVYKTDATYIAKNTSRHHHNGEREQH